jgi:ABC-2 type transport system ATP-binding protein
MAAVDVESLTVTYGKVTAVDDVSFRAEAGEVTCMLGPNGAGKTSTIEALEGLRRPTSGRLSVVGLDPQTEHFVLTERMGVMLQDGGIHPAVTVRGALRHAAALYDNPTDVWALTDRLGLGGLERRTYRQLSGGEQKRLALALALVGRPQVAFLDEPTSGVDPSGRQVIRQVISDLRNGGVTVLLTTHDLDEAERVADRVVIIDQGQVLADGPVAELTRAPEGESQVSFRAPAGLDRAGLGARVGADVVETAPGDYVVAAPPTPAVIAAITAWLAEHDLPLGDLRAGRQRLEDVYLRLTSGAGGRRRRRTGSERAAGAHVRGAGPGDAGDADTEPMVREGGATAGAAGPPPAPEDPPDLADVDEPPELRELMKEIEAEEAAARGEGGGKPATGDDGGGGEDSEGSEGGAGDGPERAITGRPPGPDRPDPAPDATPRAAHVITRWTRRKARPAAVGTPDAGPASDPTPGAAAATDEPRHAVAGSEPAGSGSERHRTDQPGEERGRSPAHRDRTARPTDEATSGDGPDDADDTERKFAEWWSMPWTDPRDEPGGSRSRRKDWP